MFSVETVNKLTLGGMPFRDAYKQVGLAIEAGTLRTRIFSIPMLAASAICAR